MSVKEIEALVQKGRANGELSNETPIPQPEHTNTDTTLALPTLEAIVENQCMTGIVREADLTDFAKYRFILTITSSKLITPGADPANACPHIRDDLHILLGKRFNRDMDMGIIGVRYMRAHNRYLVIVPSILEAASQLIFKHHEYTNVTDEHGNTYSLTFEDYPEDEETPNIEPNIKGKKEIGHWFHALLKDSTLSHEELWHAIVPRLTDVGLTVDENDPHAFKPSNQHGKYSIEFTKDPDLLPTVTRGGEKRVTLESIKRFRLHEDYPFVCDLWMPQDFATQVFGICSECFRPKQLEAGKGGVALWCIGHQAKRPAYQHQRPNKSQKQAMFQKRIAQRAKASGSKDPLQR